MKRPVGLFSNWWWAVILFAVDRVLKRLAYNELISDQGGFFYLTLKINTQAVFSWPVANGAIQLLGWAAVAVVIAAMVKGRERWEPLTRFGGQLIIVGGVSNLLDRFYYGGVIDILAAFNNLYFNLADVYLLGGAALLIVSKRIRLI